MSADLSFKRLRTFEGGNKCAFHLTRAPAAMHALEAYSYCRCWILSWSSWDACATRTGRGVTHRSSSMSIPAKSCSHLIRTIIGAEPRSCTEPCVCGQQEHEHVFTTLTHHPV